METHSNTMVPLPSLLSKERQASGSNRTRDDVPGHSDSKASNRLAKLPGHRKKMSHSQVNFYPMWGIFGFLQEKHLYFKLKGSILFYVTVPDLPFFIIFFCGWT